MILGEDPGAGLLSGHREQGLPHGSRSPSRTLSERPALTGEVMKS